MLCTQVSNTFKFIVNYWEKILQEKIKLEKEKNEESDYLHNLLHDYTPVHSKNTINARYGGADLFSKN